jgi:Flp pilus assembly protein TadD
MRSKRYEDAVPHLREALRLEPLYQTRYINLVTALVRLRRFEEAIDTARQGLAGRPMNHDARYALAFALEHAGRIDEAVREYSTLLQLSAHHPAARQRLDALQAGARSAGGS